MNDINNREKLIRELYNTMSKNQLPDTDSIENKTYYFDESTGTFYMLTGRQQIDRPNIESAKKYFESVLKPISGSQVGTANYEKALYCAIAIEAIDKLLKEKIHE